MMLLSIGTFLCAISFAFIAICLAVMLNQASKTLNHTGDAIDQVEKMTGELVHGIERTILEANRITDDIAEKMQAVEPLVESAGHMGDAVKVSSDALNIQARKLAAPENLDKIDHYVQAIKWGEVASKLYRKWKVADSQS